MLALDWRIIQGLTEIYFASSIHYSKIMVKLLYHIITLNYEYLVHSRQMFYGIGRRNIALIHKNEGRVFFFQKFRTCIH